VVSDVDAVDRALQPLLEAAGELARSASQLREETLGDHDAAAAVPAAQLAVAQLRGQARDLLARLDETGARLSVLEEAALTARSHDPELWPERRDAIAAKLAADPLDGAAAWLAAWARAFLFGCPAETERLVTEPFRLPPQAGWCVDRLGTATDALTARSVQRLAPVLRYLAAGAPLGDRPAVADDLRAHALILHARLLLQARQQGAEDLLEQASAADHHHEAEVLAVRAAMARLSAPPATAQADATDALARQAWKAERCAAAAVEMFYAESRTPLGALDNARALVGELPATADPEGALDVLVLPVPDEIWLAAGERAAREQDFGAARRLAGRVSSGASPVLAAEVADLRVRIATETGEEPAARADLLAAAGVANAIAGRGQQAMERYTEALGLVHGHEEATLGLADALLVESWGKPMHEAAGQFDRAMAMLDASYARKPLQAPTSWSLLTYSYLASALANQAVAQVRAGALWRAPIAAARAIAFDPSQAQRWVRLADTLIDLNCDQAAAVLSSHAVKLAPGDATVQRNRIVTLTNLGQIGDARALLDAEAPDSGESWFSAVRAILLQMSARALSGQAEAERLDEALAAANEALRIEPSNAWNHLVRGDLLVRAGKDDLAAEDYEYVWRESRLDQVDGLTFATRAAIELELGSDAVALSTQALDLAAATAGDYSDRFNRGAALILDGDPQGLPYCEDAIRLAATPIAIEYLRTRLDHLAAVLRGKDSAVDLTGAARDLEARAAEIAADTRAPGARIEAELDRVARNEHHQPEVGELAALATALTRAWCGLALGDPGAPALLGSLAREHPEYPELAAAAEALATAPLPGLEPAGGQAATGQEGPAQPVPAEQALQVYLPISWFAGLADPLDHEIIKRFVPDARARLRRRTGAVLPGVNFRDDASLEPAGFRIVLHGAEVAEGRLQAGRWYCQDHLAAALGPQQRTQLSSAPEAAGPAPFPVLSSFPAPQDPDPLTVLVAWPPAEVATRRIELAYATWQAAQPGAAPG
jgi:tetratricopeptide (TPR) repeat protein